MSNARNLSKVEVDTNGDIEVGSLGNANNASALTTGTLGSARLPAGSVIQVWSVEKTDVWSKSGFGFSDITGLSITLTPSSSSSKFLINFNVRASSDYFKTYVDLLRNGTVLFANADGAGDSRFRGTSTVATDQATSNAHGIMHQHSVTLLDSPATTSSVTYKLQGSGRGSTDVMYVNRSVPDRTGTEYDDRLVSNMVITEIAG